MAEMFQECGHGDAEYISDLMNGFPLTEVVAVGGLGADLPGGKCSRGRPGWPRPCPLSKLRESCVEINQQILRAAEARRPRTDDEHELACEIWRKVQTDMAAGRMGPLREVQDLDLSAALLVESFGIRKSRCNAGRTAREIHNFRKNRVNDCAWMPQTFRYDAHDHVLDSLQRLAETSREAGIELDARMGKADFRTAFKTLPSAQEQLWMCRSLLYDPEVGRYQAAPLFSHTFGNLGAVAGWFRTARALHIATTIFFLVVFSTSTMRFGPPPGSSADNTKPNGSQKSLTKLFA